MEVANERFSLMREDADRYRCVECDEIIIGPLDHKMICSEVTAEEAYRSYLSQKFDEVWQEPKED